MAGSKFGHGPGMDDWSRNISDILEEMRNRSFFDFRDSGTWQPAMCHRLRQVPKKRPDGLVQWAPLI